MIGRARHHQGRVSGMILDNVCIITTSSGTVFHAVPVGVDGPAFCRKLVAEYARPAVRPNKKHSILAVAAARFWKVISDLQLFVVRKKIGAE